MIYSTKGNARLNPLGTFTPEQRLAMYEAKADRTSEDYLRRAAHGAHVKARVHDGKHMYRAMRVALNGGHALLQRVTHRTVAEFYLRPLVKLLMRPCLIDFSVSPATTFRPAYIRPPSCAMPADCPVQAEIDASPNIYDDIAKQMYWQKPTPQSPFSHYLKRIGTAKP